jgi:hypothetical protein
MAGSSPPHLGNDLVQVEQVLPHAVDVQRVHERGAGHEEEGEHDQLTEFSDYLFSSARSAASSFE